jgi:Tfp pilus assembly protein FimT
MAERRHIHSRLAFTLIELVLVIATIAVLSAIAVPKYAQAMNRYRVDLAAKRVVADFALARSTARAAGINRVVNFASPVNGYTIVGLAAQDGRTGDYIVKLSDDPYKVKVASAAFGTGNATSVTFTRFGTPTLSGVIVVSSNGYQRSVLLEAGSGRAEVR